MSKYKTIVEDIENVTERKVIKQNEFSVIALGTFVIGGVCAWAGFSIEDPNSSVSTFLFTASVCLIIGSIVKFCMGREYYLFKPTGSRLQKTTVYFDNKESQPLQYCIEERRFEDLKHMKRQVNTGIKLEAMVASDRKFAAVQISEYVPYTYEAVSPVVCYYDSDAESFLNNLQFGR